eukprot:Skav221583  [mRNA]  locus=scaffold630:160104:168264:- [translate_table: standard]
MGEQLPVRLFYGTKAARVHDDDRSGEPVVTVEMNCSISLPVKELVSSMFKYMKIEEAKEAKPPSEVSSHGTKEGNQHFAPPSRHETNSTSTRRTGGKALTGRTTRCHAFQLDPPAPRFLRCRPCRRLRASRARHRWRP